MESLLNWLGLIERSLSIPLFNLGETPITVWTLLYLIVFVFLLFYLTGKLRGWMVDRVLARTRMAVGSREAVGSITRYLLLTVGLMIILQTIGINLTALNVLAGAIGIGLGFGLQNIANNFVSGLIILFEQPIQIGDRIEVGTVTGDVVKISARSTTVLTNDNIAIIIPNSKFITENVINWSHAARRVRFRIPVTVATGADPRTVERLLLEVAQENSDVLAKPEPSVRFLQFSEGGLYFELLAWSTSLLHRRGKLTSDLNFAIHAKLEQNQIALYIPQQEVHLHPNRSVKSSERQPANTSPDF